jgi:hypothetical protein
MLWEELTMRQRLTFAILAGLAAICACSNTKQAPKGIDADGTFYIACRGFVTVSGNLQEGYEVRFTDASGLDHDVRGIHKLEIADLPDKKVCGAAEGNDSEAKKDEARKSDVSEACRQARANGTAMKWNEKEKKFDINPVCEE